MQAIIRACATGVCVHMENSHHAMRDKLKYNEPCFTKLLWIHTSKNAYEKEAGKNGREEGK
jgi:hypothetical protein